MQRRTDKEYRLKALAKMPLFAYLSPESLRLLVDRLVRRRLEPGEMVFAEGQACEGLYLVEAGVVKLYKVSKDGREQVLATHGPGQTLSELPMIDGERYPFSAVALVKSVLLFISTEKTSDSLPLPARLYRATPTHCGGEVAHCARSCHSQLSGRDLPLIYSERRIAGRSRTDLWCSCRRITRLPRISAPSVNWCRAILLGCS